MLSDHKFETLDCTDENERMLFDEQFADPDTDPWASRRDCAVDPGVTGLAVDAKGDMQQNSTGERVALERAFPPAGRDPAVPKMAISEWALPKAKQNVHLMDMGKQRTVVLDNAEASKIWTSRLHWRLKFLSSGQGVA